MNVAFLFYWTLLSISYHRHSLENQQFPRLYSTDVIYLLLLCVQFMQGMKNLKEIVKFAQFKWRNFIIKFLNVQQDFHIIFFYVCDGNKKQCEEDIYFPCYYFNDAWIAKICDSRSLFSASVTFCSLNFFDHLATAAHIRHTHII